MLAVPNPPPARASNPPTRLNSERSTPRSPMTPNLPLCALLLATAFASTALTAQAPARRAPAPSPATAPHRTRLILKDGSYQLVMSYQIKGAMVSYVSAERGLTEELPADLVDWDATHKWEQRHPPAGDPAANDSPDGRAQPPAIDPELLKEEADRAALSPEVAPNLSLPEEDSVVALDQFRGTPELVPLIQSDGELNRITGHSILKLNLNPRAASHSDRPAQRSRIACPVSRGLSRHLPPHRRRLQIRRGGTPLTVDTHGAAAQPNAPSGSGTAASTYVIVRADVRTDARVLASFNISGMQRSVQRQQDVIETKTEAPTRWPLDANHPQPSARLRRIRPHGGPLRARNQPRRVGLRSPPRRARKSATSSSPQPNAPSPSNTDPTPISGIQERTHPATSGEFPDQPPPSSRFSAQAPAAHQEPPQPAPAPPRRYCPVCVFAEYIIVSADTIISFIVAPSSGNVASPKLPFSEISSRSPVRNRLSRSLSQRSMVD